MKRGRICQPPVTLSAAAVRLTGLTIHIRQDNRFLALALSQSEKTLRSS
jgi:hypothetical protein